MNFLKIFLEYVKVADSSQFKDLLTQGLPAIKQDIAFYESNLALVLQIQTVIENAIIAYKSAGPEIAATKQLISELEAVIALIPK